MPAPAFATRKRTDHLADLSAPQRAFLVDPAKRKGAVCGRRAGKTWVDCVGLYEAARRHPRALCPYITLSSVSARRILWPVLHEQDERYGWGLKFNDQQLTATLPENGAQILCVGGDDPRKVEALRGPKYARVVIDEAASFPKSLLLYLVEDVLEAALMDLDGDLWLTGSPNAGCVGYFHDATTGRNPLVERISTHHWTVLDNLHIPHARDFLERKRAEHRWATDHPRYLREYMGQWIRDASSLVFRFDRARNGVSRETLPAVLQLVLGIDIGASEETPSTAFVENGWEKHSKVTYTTSAKKYAGMIPSSGAEEIQRRKAARSYGAVVADAGALGKGYVREWNIRHQLGVLEAKKLEKRAYIEHLNDALDSGALKVVDDEETRELVEEIEIMQWNEDRTDIDDQYVAHAAEAWLYSWRHCFSWAEAAKKPEGPAPGSREHLLAEAEKRKQARIAESIKRQRRENMRRWGRG